MKRVGVVGLKDAWSSEALADAFGMKTDYRLIIDMDRVVMDLEKGGLFYDDLNLSELDALVLKKIGPVYKPELMDRLEMLRILSERGMPIFSDPIKTIRNLDRLSGSVTLKLGDIPVPPTVVTEDIDKAAETVERFGKAVFKPLYTSKGRGMTVIEKGSHAVEQIREYKANNDVMYIQKMLDIPEKDLGLVFLGGEYVATYARVKTNNAWNTTTHSGGKYQAHEPSKEIIDLAHRAQSLFGMDFTCVDIAETTEGPYVFEVSAFGGFRGLKEANGIDAAKIYADYVLNKIEG